MAKFRQIGSHCSYCQSRDNKPRGHSHLNVFQDGLVSPDGRVRYSVVDSRVEQLLLELLHGEPHAAPVFETLNH